MVPIYALLPPAIFDKMYKHVLTDQGLAQFNKDYAETNFKAYGCSKISTVNLKSSMVRVFSVRFVDWIRRTLH